MAREVLAQVQVALPEGDRLLVVYTVRQQPNGEYAMQMHPQAGKDGLEVLNGHQQANLLRWMADRLDIEGL